MRKFLLRAVCAWALLLPGGLPAAAQTAPAMVGMTNAAPDSQTGRSFVQYMLMVDMYEAAAGRLAVKRAQGPAIRELGRDMTARHQALSDDLRQVAGRTLVAVTPPPAFDPPHQIMYQTLSTASGADFDRAFITQQIAVHREALEYAQGYADHGKVARLREHARQMVPVLHDHLALLQGLSGAAVAVN